jgi:hypothetical protein
MDILAAMFAYLVCVTGIVGGLVMSFVIFFSSPGQFSAPPTPAAAVVARLDQAAPAPASVKTVAKAAIEAAAKTATASKPAAAEGAKTAAVARAAIEAPQKPLYARTHSRRLAKKVRARQLAYGEHSSFESRFLHFAD